MRRIFTRGALALLLPLFFACNDGLLAGLNVDTGLDDDPVDEPGPQEDPGDDDPSAPDPSDPDPQIDCEFYLVDQAADLYEVDLVNVSAQFVAEGWRLTQNKFLDIAVPAPGQIIVADQNSLFRWTPSAPSFDTAYANPFGGTFATADGLAGDKILVGQGLDILLFEPPSKLTQLGRMPDKWPLSGDVAYDAKAGKVYITAHKDTLRTTNEFFYSLDISTGVVTKLADMGIDRVSGMDIACDGKLWGVTATDPPRLMTIDPTTGKPTLKGVLHGPMAAWGASSPPN